MDLIEGIKTRRSVRKFSDRAIPRDILLEILECGRWAPSGVNYQPWKVFIVQTQEFKEKLGLCTRYSSMISQAPAVLAIYLDKTKEYHYTKHVQSIGAFFQNILLGIHALGLGGVWIGEIYNQKDKVDAVFEIPGDSPLEFMGCIAIGYPTTPNTPQASRIPLSDFILGWK